MAGGDGNACVQIASTGINGGDRIRRLNDVFRRGGPTRGTFVVTAGIQALGVRAVGDLLSEVRQFDKFDDGNDPYGEHDFGALTWQSQKVFWKIDYYDAKIEFGSPDPSDPAVTTRVLTIMLAAEY